MEQDLAAMPDDWRRALAVVAHPDDVEYGAAAAVAQWNSAGKDVGYLLLTRGEAGIDSLAPAEAASRREAEQHASAAIVGVSTVEFLGHADGVLTESVGLRREIAEAIRRHQPELVITLNHYDTFGASRWNTPDHRVAGRAALDAVGDAGNRWIFPEQIAEGGLEPWKGVRWVAVAHSPHATHAVDVGDRAFELAVTSLAQHRAYLAEFSDTDPEVQARSILSEIYGTQRRIPFELFVR